VVAEVLRSGAYSDEVVMNLVNRRFVPFWYDKAPPAQNAGDGWAYDAAAAAVIDPMYRGGPRRGGRQERSGRVTADGYPAAVFLTADGTQIGRTLFGIVPPERFVAALKDVVAAHPGLFAPGAEEQAVSARAEAEPGDAAAQLAGARLCWELAEFAGVLRCVERGLAAAEDPRTRAELRFLEGCARLCRHEPKPALDALEDAIAAAREGHADLVDDVLVARARALGQLGRHEEMAQVCRSVIESLPGGDRVGEAYYYLGLALHRLGRKDEAKDVWRRHRDLMPMDRMARRSAASLGTGESRAFLNQELLETEGWW
jgi:tetratricopeptide (TPR) repeat protein